MDKGAVQVSLPKSWHILNFRQAQIIGKFLAGGLTTVAARAAAFFALADIQILATAGDGKSYLCRLRHGDRRIFRLSVDEALDFSTEIEWIFTPPVMPWQPPLSAYLSKRVSPWQPDFGNMMFGKYLELDSLLMGYIVGKRREMLGLLTASLFAPTSRSVDRVMTAPWLQMLALTWMLSVKNYLYTRFPNLFPQGEGDGDIPDPKAVRRAVDVQIRALTKGDATKEEQVLHLNLYRALAELDAQAREAYELNNSLKNG